jgi:hypothetical protein
MANTTRGAEASNILTPSEGNSDMYWLPGKGRKIDMRVGQAAAMAARQAPPPPRGGWGVKLGDSVAVQQRMVW